MLNCTNDIGARMRMIRWNAKMTQAAFAKSLGVGTKTIMECECGRRYPRIFLMIEVAKQYNISLNWLLLGFGSKELRPELVPDDDPDSLLRRISRSGDFTAIEKRYMEKLVEQGRKPQNTVRYCGRCVHAWVTEDGAAIACSLGHECHFEEVTSNDA